MSGLYDLMNLWDLHAQVLRHRRPICLVLGVPLMPEGWSARVENHRDSLGRFVSKRLHQHVGESKDCSRWEPLGVRQSAGRMVSSVDIGAPVYQIDLFRLFGHVCLSLKRCEGPVAGKAGYRAPSALHRASIFKTLSAETASILPLGLHNNSFQSIQNRGKKRMFCECFPVAQ